MQTIDSTEHSDADTVPIYEPSRDPASDGLRELTDEELRIRLTSFRKRPEWMPDDCPDTPTRYLCRCFDYDGTAAVETATANVQWPTALRDIRCEGGYMRGATVGELAGRMLDELDFQCTNKACSGEVNRTDLISAFADFMKSASTYLLKRHHDAKRMVDAINATAKCIDLEQMTLAVTAKKFEECVLRMLELDATSTEQTAEGKYLKYPKDAEALTLLEAAAKLKKKLTKKNPKIGDKEVIQALLDEPDGNETKQQKDQRLKHQYRVWYGAVKNGRRENATATPPERLDTKTRAEKWEKHYNAWRKNLSAYRNYPPAK